MEWSGKLRGLGMDPIVFDSNGVGGYHIWTLFDREYPLAAVYNFADISGRIGKSWGCRESRRSFRQSAQVEKDDLPYGLRLPGRHHYGNIIRGYIISTRSGRE